MRLLLLVSAILVSTGTASGVEDTHGATGYWLTENEKAIVRFRPCEEGVESALKPMICGQIVWTENPREPDGDLKRDEKNPDETLRERALCGLPLVGDLAQSTDKKLEDGWIYNPRSGDTYGAEAELVSTGKLKLRGYLGISLLGSSQVWTRVEDDRGGC